MNVIKLSDQDSIKVERFRTEAITLLLGVLSSSPRCDRKLALSTAFHKFVAFWFVVAL